LILLLALGSQLNLVAQEEKEFNYYNNQSLFLYETGQWEQLIPLGKESLQQGHDFYYLRMRIGIAYYKLEKYRLAIKHFRHALRFNNNDPVALEFLYYSYLLSGQEADALTLYKENQQYLEKIDAVTTKLIKGIYTEGGYKLSNNQVDEVGGIGFFHIGLSHQISAGLNIYHGYSRVSQEFSSFTELETGGNSQGPGPGGMKTVENKITYSQDEYYIRGKIMAAKGWMVIPAYHYQAFEDSLNNHVVSIGLVKHLGIVNIYGAAGFSSINDSDQTQWTIGTTLYPLGNLNFYLQTNYTLHDQDDEQSNILFHKIGGRIMEDAWLEAFYGWGDMYNYSEMDAFYVQNIPDIIESKTGMTLIGMLKQKHKVLIGYVLENKEQLLTGEAYKHHVIYAGLSIRF
jgi:tetratricopeptide (TPR) repeat protein